MINYCSPAAAKILSLFYSIANQQVEVDLGSYNFIAYRLSFLLLCHYKSLKAYILAMFSNRIVTIFVAINYWQPEPMHLQYCTEGNLLHTLDCMLMILLVIRSDNADAAAAYNILLVILIYLYKQGIPLLNNSTQLYNYFICVTICHGYPLDNTSQTPRAL